MEGGLHDIVAHLCPITSIQNPFNTGHGDGTFSRVRTFPVDGVGIPGPAALAVGLLNKDIKHDIVVVHFSGNLVSILLNTCTKELFKHI